MRKLDVLDCGHCPFWRLWDYEADQGMCVLDRDGKTGMTRGISRPKDCPLAECGGVYVELVPLDIPPDESP